MMEPWKDARPLPGTEVVPSTCHIYRVSALKKRPEADVLWEDPLARGLFRAFLLGELRREGGLTLADRHWGVGGSSY